jgi:dipeptidyl aminopeptidase/acylaminoacyl peptidase
MRTCFLFFLISIITLDVTAQSNLTPEKLWSLGRVTGIGLSNDGKSFLYNVSVPDIKENKNQTKKFAMPIVGGTAKEVLSAVSPKLNVKGDFDNLLYTATMNRINKIVYTKEVKVQKVAGADMYPTLPKSNVLVYNDLNQRHWDTWEDGSYSHVFVADLVDGNAVNEIDIMQGEMFDCPQKPQGGSEDVILTPDGKEIMYVCKKLSGKSYALSTNTELYVYNIDSRITRNIIQGMEGYDTNPTFSKDGKTMAWLSMKTNGYESDKNEIWIMDWQSQKKTNLTKMWDETIGSIRWSNNNQYIYFLSPWHGTEQLFSLNVATRTIKEITAGQFDVNEIIDEGNNTLFVSRTDMNHAAEIYKVDISTGKMTQLTHVNDVAYKTINMSDVKERYTTIDATTKVFSWVIYPPNFDPTKKYPTLLYCQGGPQSALSQFYSFRWNFQLMASQGYIVIAPNRTGMPGWGTQWNADISKDWGGNPMRDYLAVIDDISKENYVDKTRIGAVGASYGGYSVFQLAGIHEGRFKTFISHCGLFDLKSWSGTTEELFFAHWDIGGNYWDKNNVAAQKSYEKFSPSNFVDRWNTPILIFQGGKDFRVPIEQGLQAFQAAQLKGVKSRFVLLPEENHWVLKPQNALVWQSEFYKWLKETL